MGAKGDGDRPFPWAVAACFLALGAVLLGAAITIAVGRAQPVIVDPPQQDVLQVADKPMYNIVVYGPESEIDDYGEPED